jgi:hypothetical protein
MKRIEVTAYHEAGHAVADLALGRAFRYVTIEPDEDSLGHCMGVAYRGGQRLEMDVYEGNNRARDWIERRVKTLLAGAIAERRFTGRNSSAGGWSDDRIAIDLLSHLCGTETFEIDAYIDLLIIRTRALLSVPHRWMAIQRLAAQLLDKQTVRYRDARAIADQAIADFSRMSIEQQNQMYQDAHIYRKNWKAKNGSMAK